MLNVVAIMGRLTADPVLRTTPAGLNVCTFSIACDRSYVPQGQQRQADFFSVVAWRHNAEFICKYFQKGSLVAIEGSLQTRSYQDKQGNNRTAVEIVANSINFAGAKRQPGGQAVDEGGEASPAHSQNEPPQQMGFGSQRQREQWQTAEAAPGYSQGDADDFAVIDDSDDLPF